MASSPNVTYSTITTVLEISDHGDGKYEIKELKSDEAVLPDLHGANRKQIEIPLPVPLLAVRFPGLQCSHYILTFILGCRLL